MTKPRNSINRLKDSLQAPDGWIIRWDLTTRPQGIWWTKPQGNPDHNLSGQIGLKLLDHHLLEFRKNHYVVQLALF